MRLAIILSLFAKSLVYWITNVHVQRAQMLDSVYCMTPKMYLSCFCLKPGFCVKASRFCHKHGIVIDAIKLHDQICTCIFHKWFINFNTWR